MASRAGPPEVASDRRLDIDHAACHPFKHVAGALQHHAEIDRLAIEMLLA
jgi:hypothetical protein